MTLFDKNLDNMWENLSDKFMTIQEKFTNIVEEIAERIEKTWRESVRNMMKISIWETFPWNLRQNLTEIREVHEKYFLKMRKKFK